MVPNDALTTQLETERSLLSRTMGWLGLSLALTAGGVYLWGTSLQSFNLPWFVYFLVAIGLIFGIQAAATRN
jgi:FtsH-binding integral membrane protein